MTRRLPILLLLLVLSSLVVFGQTEAKWETLATEARALAAESSWTLAAAHFEAAIEAAPPNADTRALQLELVEVRIPTIAQIRDWRERQVLAEKLDEHLSGLIPDFSFEDETGRVSAFELAVLKARLAVSRALSPWGPPKLLPTITERLAMQPATAENTARLARFLQDELAHLPTRQLLETHYQPVLQALRDRAFEPDQRAWAALKLAELGAAPPKPTPEQLQGWASARQLAQATAYGPTVDAAWFLWRVQHGWSADQALGEPADVPALIAEAEQHRSALQASTIDDSREDMIKRLASLVRTWTQPVLVIDLANHHLPDAPITFAYAAAGIDEVEFELLRLPLHADLIDPRMQDPKILRQHGERAGQWTLSIDHANDFAWHSDVHAFSPQPGPGWYALLARGRAADGGPDTHQIARFSVSSVRASVVLPRMPDAPAELILTDARTNESIAGAAVQGSSHGPGESSLNWSVTTDAQGHATGAFLPPLESEGWSQLNIAGEVDGQPFTINTHREGIRDFVADLVLDRPLYRPSETIHWKLILRQRQHAAWQIPDLTVNLLAKDSSGETLLTLEEQTLDAFGTLHGDIPLSPAIKTGPVSFELTLSNGRSVSLHELCLIDNFVPPALSAQITYAGVPDGLRPDREIPITVSAHYLSGGPAVGAKVELGLGWPLEQGHKTTTLHGTTDAKGEVVLRWQAPTVEDGSKLPVVLGATVLPPGGQPVNTRASWTLRPTGLSTVVDQTDDPLLVAPAEEVVFTGTIKDGADQPATVTGLAELVRLRWHGLYFNAEGDIVDHTALPRDLNRFELPPGWERIVEDYKETPVSAQAVTTTPDGRFSLSFTAPASGLYRLRLSDADGQVLNENEAPITPWARERRWWPTQTFDLVVFDEHTESLPLFPDSDHVFVKTGAPPLALIALSRPDRPTLLTLAREQDTHTQILPPGPALRVIDLSDAFTREGRAQIRLISIHGGALAAAAFDVKPTVSALNLAVTTTETTRPGESAVVSFLSTDADGHPTPAQVLYVAADEAVLQLADSLPQHRGVNQADFDDTSDFVGAQVGVSLAPEPRPSEPIPDQRPGTTVRARGGAQFGATDKEGVVELSAFSVVTGESRGYFAQSMNAPVTIRASRALGVAPGEGLRLRRHFASTAAWFPALETDANGEARAEFTFPDNLTSWRLFTYALSADGQHFALSTTTVRTTLPLQARLQLPRFLIAGDRSEPSVAVVNRTDHALDATVSLSLEGEAAQLDPDAPEQQSIDLPANDEGQVSWSLTATHPGNVSLTTIARADAESDGMVLPLTVHEDGLPQSVAASTRLPTGTTHSTLVLSLPDPLDPARTNASLQLASSPAVAVLDALPYLIDYPYGCVEQTMSRFLPALIVRQTLTRLGLDPVDIEARILDSESSADTRRRPATAGLSRLDDVTTQSLARLADAQNASGGWGWWPGSSSDNPWMTAYVTWGLGLAQAAELNVDTSMLQRARERCALIAADITVDVDHRAWALNACATGHQVPDSLDAPAVLADIFADRDALTPSGRAALAMAVSLLGTSEQHEIILRNLVNQTERETGDLGALVHWGSVRGHWNALNGAHEATALSVLALLELDPTHDLIEPAIAWLSLNRRSAHWDSTRATTFAVLALTRHLDLAQDSPGTAVTVTLNGRRFDTVSLSPRNLLEQPLRIPLPVDRLQAGENRIELSRRRNDAKTALYATALASAWATGEAVQPASHGIEVAREFDRLVATPTVLGPTRFTTEPQPALGRAVATEQVSARVTLHVPHALHYVMIKVPKPAGCEPLNPLSGWDATLTRITVDEERAPETRPLYREEHDDHSAIFIEAIEPGDWEITTGLRAVTPGDYRALPATAEAMYVPEITANSDARRVRIERP